MYQVIYTAKAVKSLKKIDKTQAKLILSWIEKNWFCRIKKFKTSFSTGIIH